MDGDQIKFIKRRDFIRNSLIEKGPEITYPKPDDGERIKLISSLLKLPESMRSKSHSGIRVTVYFSTMFQIDQFNKANLFETALSPTLVNGDLDYFILMKAEGLNLRMI